MKRIIVTSGFALSSLALAVSSATASEIRFDGFASFVAGQVLDKDELVQDDFRGYDDKLGFQNNSLFALQMRADLQDKLSATAQIIAKGENDYDAKFNWAYLAYELTNELTVKAGRFRTPLFMYSDFLDVGYAYHWISPPDSVYDLSGFDSSDGVMFEYQADIAGWNSLATLTLGRTAVDVLSGALDSSDSWTVTWTMNYDWFTARVVHADSQISVTNDQLTAIAGGLTGAGVTQDAIDDMLLESDRGYFNGVAVGVDTGALFATAEYSEVGSEDAFNADPKKSWYVTAGMRRGDWTFFATVENVSADAPTKSRDAITDQVDGTIAFLSTLPGQEEAIAGLQALRGGVVQLYQSSERDEDIYSIGARYNFHPAAAAKVEYMEMDDKINDVKPSAIAIAIDLVY